MAEIVVVGPHDFLLGFKLAGVKSTRDSGEEDVGNVFENLLSSGEEDVVITDFQTFDSCDASLKERLEMSLAPIIIVISESGEYDAAMRERIRTAIGVDLWDERE